MKFKIFIVLLVLSSIILLNPTTAKAEDYTKHTLWFGIDDYYDPNTGWGPFDGRFEYVVNLSSDMVLFRIDSGGYNSFAYCYLDGDSFVWDYLFFESNFWCRSYVSDTVDTSSTIYSINRHAGYAYQYGYFISSTALMFDNKDAAEAYLRKGTVNRDTCMNYEEHFRLPVPEFDSIYNDSLNKYKFYINLKQDMDRLNGCSLQYKLKVDMITDEKEFHHEQYYAVDCNNPQNLIIDLSNELVIGILDNDYEFKKIQFEFINRNYNGTNSSDTATITISESMNGIHYTTTGFPNITYPQNYQLLYDTNGVVNDMYSPPGTGGSIDLWQGSDVSGGGFVNSIINGFGLYGDNGLISLLRNMFSFIPADIWNMIAIAIGAMIVIVLFKLFIS